jgi:transposase
LWRRKDGTSPVPGWLSGLLARRRPKLAAVALTNMIARTVWALLALVREFQDDCVLRAFAAE